MLRTLSLPLVALLASGCFTVVAGDGNVVTDHRPIDASVTRIENRTELRIELVRSDTPSLEVFVDANLQGVVRTDVVGDRLVVEALCDCDGMPVGILPSDAAVVRIALPRVVDVLMLGSGDLTALELDGDRFLLEIDGSGDVTLGGHLESLEIRINGSGDVDARAVEATDARVEINGSGDVRVNASRRVDVEVHGSGDVRVYGNPARVVDEVWGSGDVTLEG